MKMVIYTLGLTIGFILTECEHKNIEAALWTMLRWREGERVLVLIFTRENGPFIEFLSTKFLD